MRIAPYDELWPREFEAEASRIEHACQEFPVRLEHIGSTAVPGLSARPCIDVLAGVPPSASRDEYVAALRHLGYDHLGAHGVPGRDYFRRGKPNSHRVHLVACPSELWRDHLLFRDYLRANPATMMEYEILKRQLVLAHVDDPRGYTADKAPFIQAVLRQARAAEAASPAKNTL